MNRKHLLWVKAIFFGSLFTICLNGCGGGSGQPEKTAGSDEIAQWVADNPAPEEIPLDDGME